MKIIILGAGQVGRTAAYQLSREQANAITVVDTNDEMWTKANCVVWRVVPKIFSG